MTSHLSFAQIWAAVRAFVVLTVILGLGYPLMMTGIAQVAFRDRAEGSLVTSGGEVVGSSLIGQSFTVPGDGVADPAYFQSRPSAAGDGYDTLASGASNLAPTSPELSALVEERRAAVAALNGVDPADVPPDALQASGSGLDPDISPAYADLQVARVAEERGLSPADVQRLVDEHTDGRALGFLGEPSVNVLELNLALDRLDAGRK